MIQDAIKHQADLLKSFCVVLPLQTSTPSMKLPHQYKHRAGMNLKLLKSKTYLFLIVTLNLLTVYYFHMC